MLVADTVLGNVNEDPTIATRLEERPDDEIERVVLDERDRRRARFRTTTDEDTDIGIIVDSERGLRPGDVLVDDEERLVIVAFEARDALVVNFDGVTGSAPALAQVAALGHHIGNHHWDLTVRGDEVLVALDADESMIRAAVEDVAPPGVNLRDEAVDPTLFDGPDPHSHGADEGYSHQHDPTHDHDPDHYHSHEPLSIGDDESREEST